MQLLEEMTKKVNIEINQYIKERKGEENLSPGRKKDVKKLRDLIKEINLFKDETTHYNYNKITQFHGKFKELTETMSNGFFSWLGWNNSLKNRVLHVIQNKSFDTQALMFSAITELSAALLNYQKNNDTGNRKINSEIAKLQKKVNSLKKANDRLSRTIIKLTNEKNELTSENNELKEEKLKLIQLVEEKDKEIKTLKQEVHQLTQKLEVLDKEGNNKQELYEFSDETCYGSSNHFFPYCSEDDSNELNTNNGVRN